jgi:hypothetical protein
MADRLDQASSQWRILHAARAAAVSKACFGVQIRRQIDS